MRELFNKSFNLGESSLTLGHLALFLAALLISWLITRIIIRLVYKAMNKRNVESGKVFAITRILKYVLYTIFFIIALQLLDLNLGGLLIGASALLIGIGIGLQQIFYDLFSGLIMLFERKVQVGDFVDMDGMYGRVDRIDMRTSILRTLDNISVVVPNSKLISENVINWSSSRGLARFSIPVGVVYGSDVNKVKDVLISCAMEHEKILKKPASTVLFRDFGESALNFDLLFWSRHFKEIEIIKSDMHFAIEKAFGDNKIIIAFPQLDVHLKRDYLK
ncbi:MAG: mechanosensitive ion channel [Bacteroidetes bacterium]|nr:mechanosensitive ion channel [Bacteroidota bacterium]